MCVHDMMPNYVFHLIDIPLILTSPNWRFDGAEPKWDLKPTVAVKASKTRNRWVFDLIHNQIGEARDDGIKLSPNALKCVWNCFFFTGPDS